jgi:hypothetical protein
MMPADRGLRCARVDPVTGRQTAGTLSTRGDAMTVRIAGFCFGSVLSALLFAIGAFAEETNECIACHEAEVLPISLGHSFDDWRGSAHARGGVGCEQCHGGDPEATDAEAAHRGVLPAAESGSLVNPVRLPATCGGCHVKELAAFDATLHARQLKNKGRGATCSTCHGAMATSLPSPHELSLRCAVCHKKPVEAQAALVVFASTKLRMRRAHRDIEAMKSTHAEWHRAALQRFHELERMYLEIEVKWHKLETREVVRRSKNLLDLTENLQEEAKIRSRRSAE